MVAAGRGIPMRPSMVFGGRSRSEEGSMEAAKFRAARQRKMAENMPELNVKMNQKFAKDRREVSHWVLAFKTLDQEKKHGDTAWTIYEMVRHSIKNMPDLDEWRDRMDVKEFWEKKEEGIEEWPYFRK
eukprot:gb/GEZN01012483.1/.p1 GENE.gb/GEZN01012483.1/~~gb/GEZN01012483.1/.p1  ORF type:complete len:128 (-),score=20.82 gb/GEZN01012483.1/:63-446(-)